MCSSGENERSCDFIKKLLRHRHKYTSCKECNEPSGSKKMQEISELPEEMLASQEGLSP